MLLVKFLPVPALRNVVTQCLTEIVSIESGNVSRKIKFNNLFTNRLYVLYFFNKILNLDEVQVEKVRQLYVSFMQVVANQLGEVDIAAAHLAGACRNQRRRLFHVDC